MAHSIGVSWCLMIRFKICNLHYKQEGIFCRYLRYHSAQCDGIVSEGIPLRGREGGWLSVLPGSSQKEV